MKNPIRLSEYVKLHFLAMSVASRELNTATKLPPLKTLEAAYVEGIMGEFQSLPPDSDAEYDLSKFEVYAIVRATLQAVCRLLGQKSVDAGSILQPYLETLRQEFDTAEQLDLPPLKELRDRTEPELREYFSGLMDFLKSQQPADVTGFVLLAFQSDKITQYVSSVDPSTIPAALREVANRIESRDVVARH